MTMANPQPRVALYPGTFDPMTNGHMDIISRAAKLVDRLVVGVAINAGKGPMFPLEERAALVRAETDQIAAKTDTVIEVMPFETLLISFARQVGAKMIVRGLRAVSDFDYEFQMAGMNYRLDSDIETVFLMASEHHQFISSRFVKDVAMFGGDISSFVPPLTYERTLERLRKKLRLRKKKERRCPNAAACSPPPSQPPSSRIFS